jgi:hypothetical protein
MKKSAIIIFLLIFLSASAVTAQYYGNSLSLGELLSRIDSSTLILGSLFIIFFALIYFSLSKTIFSKEPALGGVIAFALSMLIIYGINKSDYDIEGFFYNLGVTSDVLYSIIPILLIIAIIFMGVKFGLGVVLAVVGGGFIILSFTDWIYEKTILFIIGAIILGIGVWLTLRRSKKKRERG